MLEVLQRQLGLRSVVRPRPQVLRRESLALAVVPEDAVDPRWWSPAVVVQGLPVAAALLESPPQSLALVLVLQAPQAAALVPHEGLLLLPRPPHEP